MSEEAKLLDELSTEVPEKQEGETGAVEQTEEPTPEVDPKAVVEALLFSASSPLNAKRLGEAADLDQAAVKQHIKALNHEYGRDGRASHIIEVANGFQFMTRAEYSSFIQKLVKTRASDKLTQAAASFGMAVEDSPPADQLLKDAGMTAPQIEKLRAEGAVE